MRREFRWEWEAVTAAALEAGTNLDAALTEGETLATRLQGGVSALELD